MTSPALRAAVIFDRDGTLNLDRGYTWRPQDLVLTPGAPAAIASLNARGIIAIVATNQSGVARGLYGEADVERFHAHLQSELARSGARIDGFYFCPFHEDAVVPRYRVADHPDRKPNPGMILRALADWRLDPARTLVIGDRDHDLAAAAAAGVRGALYEGGDLAALVAAETATL
jgi:D-glycero-D-manno-heptose 1,7-bisphosphate phosphatase